MAAGLMAVLSIASGTMLYQILLQNRPTRRYQGFCAIPIDTQEFQIQDMNQQSLIEPSYRVMSLRFSSEPEVQVISTDDSDSDKVVDLLREQLQIDNDVENISVFNDGKTVNFIHDFSTNTTGIVSPERCFVMELEPELVLSPSSFVADISSGAPFDVSRVRTLRRALLPAVQPSARHELHDCLDKPIYRLQHAGPIIRKRSADAPKFDFIQFSGKHIEEIEIANLAEVLDYEKNHI